MSRWRLALPITALRFAFWHPAVLHQVLQCSHQRLREVRSAVFSCSKLAVPLRSFPHLQPAPDSERNSDESHDVTIRVESLLHEAICLVRTQVVCSFGGLCPPPDIPSGFLNSVLVLVCRSP